MIPKKIFQTWETDKPPFKMSQAMESWKQKNPNWEYKLFTAQERIKFIKKHFGKEVLDAYYTLVPGAFKADLWRYCVLYVHGGVYVDSDMICETPLDTWIIGNLVVVRDDPMAFKWLANGFIAAKPNHKAFKIAIDQIVLNCKNKNEMFYLDYTGPALWGKSVNKYLNNNEEQDYELGPLQNDILVIQHDYAIGKFVKDNLPVLLTEYKEYREEMKQIGNPPFFDYVQSGQIYNEIPRTIIWTTYDCLDHNQYMIDSFSTNQDYEFKYFSQKQVDEWFANSIYDKQYKVLTQRGEKTDFFRYCYLYENGGIYVDADTYCNQPLDSWIKGQDLIVGLEANINKKDDFGFKDIGQLCNNNYVSVCNWAFAVKKEHPVISDLINDIINNPKEGVIQNTGPGRFTHHMISYFGKNNDFTQDVKKDKSILLSINRFGSNQSHSNSIKQSNPFNTSNKDILITHMFDGTWRGNQTRKDIILLPKETHPSVSHNLTLYKTQDGYKGISRFDINQERTRFMEKIGEVKTVKEYTFTEDISIIDSEVLPITGYSKIAKFEDYRHFKYKGKDYYCTAYIDNEFNTNMCVLDEFYNYLGDIIIDSYNKMSFGVGPEVYFEKNWLFFEKDKDLYFIYSTTPNLVIYKCTDFDNLIFEKHLTQDTTKFNNLPQQELYFSKVTTGGSTNPIVIDGKYVYLIHTKIYTERSYNHWVVTLDKHLNLLSISELPFIGKRIGYSLFFITTMLDKGDNVIITGGVEDNQNFIWEIPKNKLKKLIYNE